jgi:hypothetical protein
MVMNWADGGSLPQPDLDTYTVSDMVRRPSDGAGSGPAAGACVTPCLAPVYL